MRVLSIPCFFILFLEILIVRGLDDTKPLVSIPQGSIQGIWKTTENGRRIQAFLGIPYAKPPVGPLRFQNPVPADSWNGIRNGTTDSTRCIQGLTLSDNVIPIGSEDCLYLNVYTPSIPISEIYPVMVFIYGGAYSFGRSSSDVYGPDLLLDKDVILVTLNYRLGVIGLASTEDEVMPGNYAFKDQVLALKWVRSNIGKFGGKSDSITLFGESSGSVSVHFHMLSPLSKGLFQRSILMSGSAYSPWAISPHGYAANNTKKIASLVNCPSTTSKELVDCLRIVPVESLIIAAQKIKNPGLNPLTDFKAVFESEDSNGAFVTRKGYLNITSDTEMMAGITSEEGTYPLANLYSSKKFDTILAELNSKWLQLAPILMNYGDTATDIDNVSRSIREYYFKGKSIDRRSIPELIRMLSNSFVNQGLLSAIKGHKGISYVYEFAHKGDNSITFRITNSTFNYGVCHGDDLIYLFPLLGTVARENGYFGFSEKDKAVSEQMVNMFTRFAAYGNPTIDGIPVTWKPYSNSAREYHIIQGQNYKMGTHFLRNSDQFWSNLTWMQKLLDDNVN